MTDSIPYEQFTIIPNWIHTSKPKLTPNEKDALIGLYSFRNATTETVWPGLLTLAERVGLRQDRSYMSKIMSRLEKKGYIEKKSRGFNKSNEYTLKKPDQTATGCINSTTYEKTSQVVQKVQPKVVQNIQPGVVQKVQPEHTKEHTKEHTIYYSKINLKKSLNVISQETAKEFIEHRKKKKAPLTQGAFDRIVKKSVSAAKQFNRTPDEIIEEVIDAGWQSFQHEWLKKRFHVDQQTETPQERAKRKVANILNGNFGKTNGVIHDAL